MQKNYDLDFDNCITIKPTAEFTPDTAIIADAPLNKSHLQTGKDTHSLGSSPVDITALQESLGTQDKVQITDIVIKKPNSDEYNIPAELAPISNLIRSAANHEYKNSPYASQKIAAAFIVCYPDVNQKTRFNGHTWHIDILPATDDVYEGVGLPIEHRETLKNISQKMLLSQTFYSSSHATHIQKQPLEKAHKGMAHTARALYSLGIANPDFKIHTPQDHEVISGLSPYHCSQEIDYTNRSDEPRLLCVIFHAHTHESAEQFFRDNPNQDQDVTSWQQLRTYDPF